MGNSARETRLLGDETGTCIRGDTQRRMTSNTITHNHTHTKAPAAETQATQFAVNQIGRAVCGLRFDNPELIIADLGPTFRDLSIGTLASCASFDCLGAV